MRKGYVLGFVAAVFVLTSCATVPERVTVDKQQLEYFMDEYSRQQSDMQELKTLREWKRKMFF